MLLGTGVDIVQIQRIQRICERWGASFRRRIFDPIELAEHPPNAPFTFIAGRFAAKEAAAKALRTGIAKGVSWHDLRLHRDADGAPRLEFAGRAKAIAHSMGVTRNMLSISHERDYAIAFVVLEGMGQ